MDTRRTFLKNSCLAAAVFGAPSVLAAAPDKRDRPDILFIMTDQQFADAMSCAMGARWLKTPAMDSLADSGTLFSRAYSPNPLCMPARNSIFTGRYPHETGVTRNGRAKIDPEEFLNMGNYFLRAGYETAYFGKWHLCFNSKDSKSHGFQIAKCLYGNGHDSEVGDLSAEYLASKNTNQPKPLMTVVSLSNPHDICQLSRFQKLPSGPIGKPPKPENCPPVPQNLAPPINETDTMTTLRKGYQGKGSLFPVGDFTDGQWRQLRWGYYRLIEKVDAEIAKVLAALAKSGRDENTVIIFTSDHGDCAGAHRFNQKTVFYDESARVPLIIRRKGETKKRQCDKLVNTGVDILPTMLDYAGIAVPKKLPGRSLRPIVAGKPPADWPDHLVIQNHLSQTVAVDGIRATAQGRMVRTEQYKYCVYDHGTQRESLVDMKNDPLETKNIATDPANKKIIETHRNLLLAFAEKHKDPLGRQMLADGMPAVPFKHAKPKIRKKKKK
ncbi:MAG: sulfatase-like hydrolase/transferase [Phycisphaerales bacterium]|jgi:arylsulfatase A-like enzyme|nr:sulfatase-like hydrolase/transferase [Phycisphaerales bacterium]